MLLLDAASRDGIHKLPIVHPHTDSLMTIVVLLRNDVSGPTRGASSRSLRLGFRILFQTARCWRANPRPGPEEPLCIASLTSCKSSSYRLGGERHS